MLVYNPEIIFIVLVFAYWAFTGKLGMTFRGKPISGKLIGWTLIVSELLVIAINSIMATYM